MKVLHVTSGNLYGGIETMLVTIARFRDAAPGMDSQFAICFGGRLGDELAATGALVHDLGPVRARNPLRIRQARRMLADLISGQGIDVVVCHSSWPLAMFGSTVRAGGKVLVHWVHGPSGGASWLERWARRVKANLVIFNSRYTASTFGIAHEPPRSEIVYCPVQPQSGGNGVDGSRRDSIRAEFGASQADVVIVQVSRIEEWKGHRLLLGALAKLSDLKYWRCWIVGGPQRPSEWELFRNLQVQSKTLGISDRVRFVGQRSDVCGILAAADIHCQPNTEPEPFGITFVEALYAGLPVVSTAVGGALEIVDETCGRLAREINARMISEVLRPLIIDPDLRKRLGAAGPQRAAELCDPTQQLKAVERILGRLIVHRGASE